MSAHHCHAVGCEAAVPPRLFMCARHWRMVPAEGKRQVWANYRAGQEVDKRPSSEYLRVTDECRRIVAHREGRTEEWAREHEQYARTILALQEAGR